MSPPSPPWRMRSPLRTSAAPTYSDMALIACSRVASPSSDVVVGAMNASSSATTSASVHLPGTGVFEYGSMALSFGRRRSTSEGKASSMLTATSSAQVRRLRPEVVNRARRRRERADRIARVRGDGAAQSAQRRPVVLGEERAGVVADVRRAEALLSDRAGSASRDLPRDRLQDRDRIGAGLRLVVARPVH